MTAAMPSARPMPPADEGTLPGVRAAGHLQLPDVAERDLGQRRIGAAVADVDPAAVGGHPAAGAGEPVPPFVAQADPGARGGIDRLQRFGGKLLRHGRNGVTGQQEECGDDGVRAHLCSR